MIAVLGPGACVLDAATGVELTGARLAAAVWDAAAALERVPPGAVLCLTATDVASVVRYLGVLAAGRPAILWDPGTPPPAVDELIGRFEPAAVVGLHETSPRPVPSGYSGGDLVALGPAWIRGSAPTVVPHEQLGLLLATSGSAGRPRLVRHSVAAVRASAAAIRSTLRINAHDVAITSLPLFYPYGLSVLHSHLMAGASVVVEPRGVLDPGFWASVERYGVTSIAGVPHTYELLVRKPWRPASTPWVRSLTVSGGRLRDRVVTHFHTAMAEHGGRLYVMYGQTEAGSQICVLPPEKLPAKLGSVGPPVVGMRLSIAYDGQSADEVPAGRDGEVVCHSAAVMMGYADRAEDLARGDDLRGTLRTGDRGRLDEDGYLWLSGRDNRIARALPPDRGGELRAIAGTGRDIDALAVIDQPVGPPVPP